MRNTIYPLPFLAVILLVISCSEGVTTFGDQVESDNYSILSKYLDIPEQPYNYTPVPPAHAGRFVSNPDDRFLHPEQIKLRNYKARAGRVLFYDTRLSINNTVSCASCHKPERAFADGLKTSLGFEGVSGVRNSLALGNTIGFEFAYGGENDTKTAFFSWDDFVPELQEQIRNALTSSVEMGMNMTEVVRRVREEEIYQILFEEATPQREIDEISILGALEAFVNGIIASGSRFDTELNTMEIPDPDLDFAGFSDQENLGKKLFNRDCSSCHSKSHVGVQVSSSNNGLELRYSDSGKGLKTGLVEDMGVFKVPFLRNVALTAPYMHDGRFQTLQEVLRHYSENIAAHPNLGDALITPEGPVKFNYTDKESDAIISYLQTLTDYNMIQEKKYQDPFK